jgi:hypothetical protein
MTAKTFRAQVVLVGSGLADQNLGEGDITTRDIMEQGRHVGFYAHFDADGQTVSGTVVDISPADLEQKGVTPIVRVNRN